MNKVMLVGRLTRDPELRSLPSGKHVATFTIATNEFRGGNNKRSEYHPAWRGIAWPRSPASSCRRASWSTSRAGSRLASGMTTPESGTGRPRSWSRRSRCSRPDEEGVRQGGPGRGRGSGWRSGHQWRRRRVGPRDGRRHLSRRATGYPPASSPDQRHAFVVGGPQGPTSAWPNPRHDEHESRDRKSQSSM